MSQFMVRSEELTGVASRSVDVASVVRSAHRQDGLPDLRDAVPGAAAGFLGAALSTDFADRCRRWAESVEAHADDLRDSASAYQHSDDGVARSLTSAGR